MSYYLGVTFKGLFSYLLWSFPQGSLSILPDATQFGGPKTTS